MQTETKKKDLKEKKGFEEKAFNENNKQRPPGSTSMLAKAAIERLD